MKSWSVAIQNEATEHTFWDAFIMLLKEVLTSESLDEALQSGYSNDNYWAVLSCDIVYCVVAGGYEFECADKIFLLIFSHLKNNCSTKEKLW